MATFNKKVSNKQPNHIPYEARKKTNETYIGSLCERLT